MNQRFATAVLLIAAAGTAGAEGPLQNAVPEPAVAERATARPSSRLQLHRGKSGTTARRFASRPYPGTTSDAARAFLAEHSDIAGSARLTQMSERRLGNHTYVRFQQQIDGIPVRGAQVVISVNASNSVRGVNSRVQPALTRAGEWRLSREDALARAIAAHGGQPSDTPSATQEYEPMGGRAVAVWTVVFRSGDPAGDWEYLIAADDGRVLGRENLRRGASAPGYAYPRNPVRGGRERVMLENIGTDGSLTSTQSKVLTYFPALKGQVAPGTAVQGAAMRNGGFLYEADDARAAEVQLYWGMETAGARFRALGFPGFKDPLRGIVFFQDWDAEKKTFTGANNAFFLPNAFGEGRGGVSFYLTAQQGDTSLDTDVIFHEYAHAVINEFVGPRQSAGFRALNEGTADYFSSSFLDDPVMAEYAAKIFGLRMPFLRRTDNEHSWPYNTVGEEHADGNIWSGALWDVRRVLGATVTDKIALETVAMLSSDSEFADAAWIAVLTAEELFGERVADTVATIMEERGILTDAAETASEAKWMEPGSSAKSTVPAAKSGYVLLGAQQYRIDVPHRATKLRVRLRSTANARFYLRYRVPVTIEDGKLQAEQLSETGTNVSGWLSLDNTPELQAGTYYIAVVNASTSPIEYNLEVQIDDYDRAARPALILLEDGVAARGSMPSGPFLGSRQFAVQVPEGTAALTVTLEGDEDVDLYVRQGRIVVINGTGFPEADLVSNSESSREDLRITGAGGGPIPPGVYVLATYNYSQATTRFRITARLER